MTNMTNKPDNPPVFPEFMDVYGQGMVQNYRESKGGMTLRDYFAAKALQGILAGGFADTIPHDDINGGGDAAYFAYLYADAMLAQRTKESEA